MPNWCENTLYVYGNEKDIKRFKKKAKYGKTTDLSLNKFVPLPKELKGTKAPSDKKDLKLIKKYGADNWYNWQVKNWGTKWDLLNAELLYDEPEYLTYSFESAWSPPVEWLENMCKSFKRLYFKLKYDEESMCFMGIAIANKGKLLVDKTITYN